MRDKVELMLVDYLQLIEPEDRRVPREEQVALAARTLPQPRQGVRIPVIALAQLNREVESRPGGKPRLADLRESGAIEMHADCVWLLHNPPGPDGQAQQNGAKWLIEIGIRKNRDGQCGEAVFDHIRAEMRFESVAVASAFPTA